LEVIVETRALGNEIKFVRTAALMHFIFGHRSASNLDFKSMMPRENELDVDKWLRMCGGDSIARWYWRYVGISRRDERTLDEVPSGRA
jgi:hypothetical protein